MSAPSDLAGRAGKILGRFPTFMLAPSPDKALATIAEALGKDLDESERLATRIQRAHRLPVADEAADVLGLAALLTLRPADVFIVSALHAHGLFGYDAYVEALRGAVRRMVAVLTDGCGTLWALLEGTAILLHAERSGAIEHVDAHLPQGGFVHRLAVRHHVIEDGEPATRAGSIYLVENPIVERATDDLERRQRETFRVRRGGFFPGPVAIQVTGTGDRTVLPTVIDRARHEGVGYDGVLADGQKLVFTAEGTVLLDGVDVSGQAYAFRGALADDSPLDGEPPEDVTIVAGPPRPLELPLGDTDWRFSVHEGHFDASSFERAVYRLPADPAALAALPASGRVQLSWEENEPFAATILIPAALKSLEEAGLVDTDLPTLVRAGLERFRSAGVRLDVTYFDEDWILGKSVLESVDAPAGPGVDFDATIPAPP